MLSSGSAGRHKRLRRPGGDLCLGRALDTTLAKLGKAGLEPNKKKFKVFGTTEDACADKPEWLDEAFVVTDPVARVRVEAAEAGAEAPAEAAAAASPENARLPP